MPTNIDHEFIKKVEASHFRTDCDSGANENALMIWNMVREHTGLPRLLKCDLPSYCVTHSKYHIIQPDYGCCRKSDDASTEALKAKEEEWPKFWLYSGVVYQANSEEDLGIAYDGPAKSGRSGASPMKRHCELCGFTRIPRAEASKILGREV